MKKRYRYILIVIMAVPVLISSMTVVQREPCACITVNASVVGELNYLKKRVDQYGKDNGGMYPSFKELHEIMISERPYYDDMLIRGATRFNGQPEGPSGRAYRHNIVYSVSEDGHRYALVGIGETENYIALDLFGKTIKIPLGRTYPVLEPGDTPPYPSPYM